MIGVGFRPARRAPLINRGYYARVKVIDHLVASFARLPVGEERMQIICLGAGFDTTYFKMLDAADAADADAPAPHLYVEVDYANVATRKADIIRRDQKLSDRLGLLCPPCATDAGMGTRDQDGTSASTSTSTHTGQEGVAAAAAAVGRDGLVLSSQAGYRLVACDLNDTAQLNKRVVSASTGVVRGRPTLIISECVTAYLAHTKADAIFRWAAESFDDVACIVYEPVVPHDAFGHQMVGHFERNTTPLLTIAAYPTLDSEVARFSALGWRDTQANTLRTALRDACPAGEVSRVQQLEPFDEWEEYEFKCNHYAVITAVKGPLLAIGEAGKGALRPNRSTTGEGTATTTSKYPPIEDATTTARAAGMATQCAVAATLPTGSTPDGSTRTATRLLPSTAGTAACSTADDDAPLTLQRLTDGRSDDTGSDASNPTDQAGLTEPGSLRPTTAALRRWSHCCAVVDGKILVFGG